MVESETMGIQAHGVQADYEVWNLTEQSEEENIAASGW